ncbi:MAG: LPD1 domain-containing protein, partial [Thiohalocapsa sp.]
DSLLDLAEILDIPPRAISLNGTLGLAFGARGHGWAAAHYEPGTVVINLTKTKGAGSLAHEWFHALDNYFSRQRTGGEVRVTGLDGADAYRRSNFVTYKPEPLYVRSDNPRARMSRAMIEARHQREPENPYWAPHNWEIDPAHPKGVRPEVERRFAELVEALNASPMKARSQKIDKGKEGYWSRIIERGARSFENYVISKMAERGYQNDYLANVTQIEDFQRDVGRYPYLKPDEIAPVAEAFDNLFATIETKADEQGNVVLFSLGEQFGMPGGAVESGVGTGGGERMSARFLQARVDSVTAGWSGLGRLPVRVVQAEEAMPQDARRKLQEIRAAKPDAAPMGFYYRGLGEEAEYVLIADNLPSTKAALRVLLHETIGHNGVSTVLGPTLNPFLDELIADRNDVVAAMARDYGLDMTDLAQRREAAEEVLAHMAETQAEGDLPFLKRVYQAVRALLRKLGVKLRLSDGDIRALLIAARRYVQDGDARRAMRARSRAGQMAGRAEVAGDKTRFSLTPSTTTADM